MGASAMMAKGGCAVFRANSTAKVRSNAVFHKDTNPVYGDGSLNGTENGYATIYSGNYLWPLTYSHVDGNCYRSVDSINSFEKRLTLVEDIRDYYWQHVYSGTNRYPLTETSGINKWIRVSFMAANSVETGIVIGALKIEINGSMFTLSECVALGYVEPLVIIMSGSTGPYIFQNLCNVYTGGNTDNANAPKAVFLFKIKQPITAVQFYSNKSFIPTENGFAVLQYANEEYSISPFALRDRAVFWKDGSGKSVRVNA